MNAVNRYRTTCSAACHRLADLRGKRVVLLENTTCEMSQHWMCTLLLKENLGAEGAFFSRVDTESKSTRALLPVFFGNVDACIVNRPVFETMCELNPQIGRHLRRVAVSEPLVGSVTFLGRASWHEPRYRQDMIDALQSLHEDPAGRQILTLFKSKKLAPFDERSMTVTRALRAAHDRLVKEALAT